MSKYYRLVLDHAYMSRKHLLLNEQRVKTATTLRDACKYHIVCRRAYGAWYIT